MLEVLTDIALFLIYVDDILVRTPKIRNSHRIGTALDGCDSVDIFVDIGDRDSTSIIIRWRMFQWYGKAFKVLFDVVDAFIFIGVTWWINDLAVLYTYAINRVWWRALGVRRLDEDTVAIIIEYSTWRIHAIVYICQRWSIISSVVAS